MTYETPGTVDLSVRNPEGSIHVVATDEDKTVVTATGPRVDELIHLSHRPHGDRHDVSVVVDARKRGLLNWRSESIDIEVRLPAGSDVRILTASSDVTIEGEVAVVDVKAASGDVRVDTMDSGRVVNASGDLKIGAVRGDAQFNIVSGNVLVGVLDGDVTVRSVSGDIRVDCAIAGELAVRTVSGDVDVAVRRGSTLHVDAQAVSGDMSSEIDLGEAPADDEADGDGALLELRVVSVSGDVRVRRSNREPANSS